MTRAEIEEAHPVILERRLVELEWAEDERLAVAVAAWAPPLRGGWIVWKGGRV